MCHGPQHGLRWQYRAWIPTVSDSSLAHGYQHGFLRQHRPYSLPWVLSLAQSLWSLKHTGQYQDFFDHNHALDLHLHYWWCAYRNCPATPTPLYGPLAHRWNRCWCWPTESAQSGPRWQPHWAALHSQFWSSSWNNTSSLVWCFFPQH